MAGTRSPNYPSLSLGAAVELARRLHDKERRSPAEADQVVRAWGYSGLSGPSRSKLSALRKYGLLEETSAGFRLTDRAMAILFPRDQEEMVLALREAATSPELFRDLAAFEGASDDNLVSRLVRLSFTPAGARAAVASYRETMGVVESEATAYNASHGEWQDPPSRATASAPNTAGMDAPMIAAPMPDTGIGVSIGLPGGGRADLRISGRLTAEGLDLIRDYLKLVEKSVAAAETVAGATSSPADAGDGSGAASS